MSQTQSSKQFSWTQIPLYLQIAIALILAVGLGVILGAGQPNPANIPLIKNLVIGRIQRMGDVAKRTKKGETKFAFY
jgi:Na+/H+-dicarboxylate symporter